MAFIRDAWYCAGFTNGLKAGELKPLTILDEAVVLYRQADGAAKALADRCPHRFAPLSKGKVCDGEVQRVGEYQPPLGVGVADLAAQPAVVGHNVPGPGRFPVGCPAFPNVILPMCGSARRFSATDWHGWPLAPAPIHR